MVEEDGVDRLAYRVVATEREGDVRDAPRGLGMGEGTGDLTHRLDVVHAVVVVLLDAGGDGEDVGVEDDVLWWEANPLGKDTVGASADLGLPRNWIRLALLVGSDHDHGGTILLQEPRLPDELFFTLLHADGVDHRLALHTLEARLDDRPLRGVDHHGHTRDVRLGGDEVEEVDHRLLSLEHPFIHVDVYHLGAVLHLLLCHFQRRLIVAREDQILRPPRTGNVGALADVHEQRVRSDVGRFEPVQAQLARDLRHLAWWVAGDGISYGLDVLRCGAAATADDVEPAVLGPLSDLGGHVFGGLVVLAELVGQPGVRVGTHVGIGDTGELFDVLSKLRRSQGTVEADANRLGVAHGVPESFRHLARQRTPTGVGDGARDHDRDI